MGSRIRLDPDHVFEVFLELAKPPEQSEEAPYILQIYPDTYRDEEVLKSVPKFAFPCLVDDFSNVSGEHFTFVLTDIESRFKFGFCRMSVQTCLCIISCLPWYEIFYQLLDHIYSQLSYSPSITPFLNALHATKSFRAGEKLVVTVASTNEKHSFFLPIPNQLPALPDNKSLLEFCTCMDINNMMIIFASMLYERRILAVSQSLNRLTACIPGAALLLHPMNWQHLYIPVLPPHLLDYCSAPMPYLIGVHSSVMKKAKLQEHGDAVILNLDTNDIQTEYNDLAMLPEEVVSSLKRRLKQEEKMHSNQPTGDGIARAFLKTMVALIGGYRDALRFRPGEPITFDPDAFVVSRPVTMQPFLQKVLQLQSFQQFIADRLDMLNAGEGFKDDFDIEASLYSDKYATQSRYKDWLGHMKKQGKKLRREGKDKWIEFTAKVKDRSKKTFKDLASRIEDIKKEDGPIIQSTPKTGVYAQAHRPPRPPPPNLMQGLGPIPAPRQPSLRRQSLERVQRYHPIIDENGVVHDMNSMKLDRLSSDDSDITLNPLRRINTDLMADPDIQKAFKKSYSLEELKASPVLVDTDGEDSDNVNGTVVWERLSEQMNLPEQNWSHMNSDLSLDSKSSGSFTGTGSLASTNDICRVRPVPTQRQSVLISNFSVEFESQSDELGKADQSVRPVGWSQQEQPLIMLDTSNSNSSFNSLENVEFDPLKQLTQAQQPTEHTDIHHEKSLPPIPKPRLSRAKGNAVPSSPSPKPAVGWSPSPGITYRTGPSPLGFDSQTSMKEARAAFIQSQATKPVIPKRQESLDQFDPLASGQLVLDMPSELSTGRSVAEDEDNLLKEWNLDFDRIKQVAGNSGTFNSGSAFSSMPNLIPSSKGYYPSRPVGSGYYYSPVVQPVPNQQQLMGGGLMVGHSTPGLVGSTVPTNLPTSQQPRTNLLHPMAPGSIAGTSFPGRSATLPYNSALTPNVFSKNVTEMPYGSMKPNASSGQLSADVFPGGKRSPFDPLLQSTPRDSSRISQNSNHWEKFE